MAGVKVMGDREQLLEVFPALARQVPLADLYPPSAAVALHHRPAALVAVGAALRMATVNGGAHVAVADMISVPVWVMYQELALTGVPADHQDPVAAACGRSERDFVKRTQMVGHDRFLLIHACSPYRCAVVTEMPQISATSL